MREFYIYGFKSRGEYTLKSARSYDDERRRLESWLGGYMGFTRAQDGKNVFISVDSRECAHNPLYKGFKAASFTDGDITLHFFILDILSSPEVSFTSGEITALIDNYVSLSGGDRIFDESTVRKKLKEYVQSGILVCEKSGGRVRYSRAGDCPIPDKCALDFFSEVMPCGVAGSFLLDKCASPSDGVFSFKHHYITDAADSEIIYLLFSAMRGGKYAEIRTLFRDGTLSGKITVVPLRIMLSRQGGRGYLAAYVPSVGRMRMFRLDSISSVKSLCGCADFDSLRADFEAMRPHIWGVSIGNADGENIGRVSFTVRYSDSEPYIHTRLVREKRCGFVERIDANHSRFTAELYDLNEILPWIRTFIGRITDISFSDPAVEARFKNDLGAMYELYGLTGEGGL